jgi:uncharacterized protein YceK
MAYRAVCIALLLVCLPIAGCGTVTNLANTRTEEGGTSPFGGVKQDMACIHKAANGEFGVRTHPKSEAEKYPQAVLMLFCAADLPFSLIADVVMWPYTVSYTCINRPLPTPPVILTPAEVRSESLPSGPLPTPMKQP